MQLVAMQTYFPETSLDTSFTTSKSFSDISSSPDLIETRVDFMFILSDHGRGNTFDKLSRMTTLFLFSFFTESQDEHLWKRGDKIFLPFFQRSYENNLTILPFLLTRYQATSGLGTPLLPHFNLKLAPCCTITWMRQYVKSITTDIFSVNSSSLDGGHPPFERLNSLFLTYLTLRGMLK